MASIFGARWRGLRLVALPLATSFVATYVATARADEPPAPTGSYAQTDATPNATAAPDPTTSPFIPDPADAPSAADPSAGSDSSGAEADAQHAESAHVAPSTKSEEEAREHEDPPKTIGYGKQTAIFDGSAFALGVTAFSMGRGPLQSALSTAFLGTYLIGAPAVHLSHGRVGVAIASFLLRVGAPTITGLTTAGIGAAVLDNRHTQDREYGNDDFLVQKAFLVGAGMGAIAAALIDGTVFAQEPPRPDDRPRGARPSKTVVQWTPDVRVGPGQAMIGVRGVIF